MLSLETDGGSLDNGASNDLENDSVSIFNFVYLLQFVLFYLKSFIWGAANE